jgi:hypothetical protein
MSESKFSYLATRQINSVGAMRPAMMSPVMFINGAYDPRLAARERELIMHKTAERVPKL